ncbi:MAG: hypothetical protein VBE63_02180 [Lamprobacter sp.]|uniref:hypothetical protein n=1 Tax=Lamprobacter sp. TaxID=3100796 RepID=UPI002B25EF4C|nr:hypothetical protein [Lamprobacter sp.]MEA3638734.1 hypothetical protein [Lamprobacter sp.]
MDINSLFPSNYLKAADLQGQVRRVTIANCAPEQLGQGEIKPALQFRGVPKKLILNKTNGLLIAASFGTETTAWAGREIELYPENVMFQGQVVPAIRVRVPIGAAQAPAAAVDPFAHAAPAPQAPAVTPQPPQAAPPSIPAPVPPPPAVPAPAAPEPAPTAPQQAEQAQAATAPQQQQPEQAATPAQAELPIDW